MKCERCKKRDATIHLTEIIKNVKSEFHLCEECARIIGVNSKFSNFSLSVPDMLSFLDLDDAGDVVDTNMCMHCGISFVDYKKAGKLGCPHCYRYLKQGIDSVVKSYHDSIRHVGKVPCNYVEIEEGDTCLLENDGPGEQERVSRQELQKMLDDAVSEERYEDAAVLRDRIKEIEVANGRKQ
ncbi:MAG TPA: UvrB/UvrC motif-containing protein [Spirochaetota bacterium]|nr:UvrB/UvrC motif-containing protein [Spirochaetota bacterium]HPJ37421.1 UvrB/UvrC motif-containing protein [Spirochaetota bacterium]